MQALAVIVALLILVAIGLIFWNVRLTEQLTELRLRHEQLEGGFADFMDEYYQTEMLWPDDFQFIGQSREQEG